MLPQFISYAILLTTLLESQCVSSKLNTSDSLLRLVHKNQTDCKLWFYYNESLDSCQCLPYSQFVCKGENAYFSSTKELTYDKKTNTVTMYHLQGYEYPQDINQTKQGYRLLPKNISNLNELMCRPLNRRGYLCSDCIHGFGPAMSIMLYYTKCYKCMGDWSGATLYILIQFVPVTIFYFFILVVQARLTSAPMVCYIMYSQLIVLALLHQGWSDTLLRTVFYTASGDMRTVTKVIFLVYGSLNLDFILNALPPFCISTQLRESHLAILGYASALHPILLVILTWLGTELHDRNVKVVVYLWAPVHRCFVRLRRSWNTKSDLIDVFASFLLLSYTKLMYQTMLMGNTDMIYNLSLREHHISYIYVLGTDIRVRVQSPHYIATVFIAVTIAVIFNLLPMLLLAL